jgi:hypothetical protein
MSVDRVMMTLASRSTVTQGPNERHASAVRTAQRSWARSSYQPPTPVEITQFFEAPERHLATDLDSLLDGVLGALSRIQTRLHGVPPEATFLWNFPADDSKRWPRRETEVSDWLSVALRQELSAVLINREVELRPTLEGISRGQRVDLLIQQPQGSAGTHPLRLIAEVKCCWNSDLRQALKDQLADRYLKGSPNTVGLYLVAHFNCVSSTHGRRSCITCRSGKPIQVLRSELTEQAEALRKRGVAIAAAVLDTSLSGTGL